MLFALWPFFAFLYGIFLLLVPSKTPYWDRKAATESMHHYLPTVLHTIPFSMNLIIFKHRSNAIDLTRWSFRRILCQIVFLTISYSWSRIFALQLLSTVADDGATMWYFSYVGVACSNLGDLQNENVCFALDLFICDRFIVSKGRTDYKQYFCFIKIYCKLLWHRIIG